MPTYEYACKKCGEHTEAVQSFTDKPLTKCPACGGQLRKVFGNVGIVFKGSGFYKTDSRPADKKSSEAKSDTKTDTKSDTKAETKPDSKTDAKPAATKKPDKPAAAAAS